MSKKTLGRGKRAIRQYDSLVLKVPPELKQVEAVVRSTYARFLYNVLQRADPAIDQLEKACHAFPTHAHSLHKLASVYLEEAEIRTTERRQYLKKAQQCLEGILRIEPNHSYTRLSLAILGGRTVDWNQVPESTYWTQVSAVYLKYLRALQPNDAGYPNLHNSIVHHAAGTFLWHVEATANKRGLPAHAPAEIPAAEVEFLKSLEIEKQKTDGLLRNVTRHLILAKFTLGSYYMTIAKGSEEIFGKGQQLLSAALTMSRNTGTDFDFRSQNSWVESFIGKLFLNMRENEQAKEHFARAVRAFERNWRAQWFLGRIHEYAGEFTDAVNCFMKSAVGQASPGLFGQLRSILQQWQEPSVEFDTMPHKVGFPGLKFDMLEKRLRWRGEMSPADKDALLSLCPLTSYQNAIRGLFEKSQRVWAQLRASGMDFVSLEKLRMKCSLSAYELDPDGNLNPKNVSDYAYDLYLEGKNGRNRDALRQAKDLLLRSYKRYLEVGLEKGANFPLWYAGECAESLNGAGHEEALTYYIESAILENSRKGYGKLARKLRECLKYAEAIHCFLNLIDQHPRKDNLYRELVEQCCSPIWRQQGAMTGILSREIESCFKRHADVPVACRTFGIILQRDGQDERALPYLERFQMSDDPEVLRALMYAYRRLGQTPKAESVYHRLLTLVRAQDQEILKRSAARWGFNSALRHA